MNLPERPDKLDAFTLTSEITGFEYEVIEGVKGGEISDKALPPVDAPLSIIDRAVG